MTTGERRVLDLGCGRRKRPGAVGVDVNPRSEADVLHDLNHYPYPFAEDHFSEVYADNVLEHLDDVLKVMIELHRITRSDGVVEITVPFYAHRNANTDPTHRHWFGVHSFDYFVEGTDHGNFRYSPIRFTLLSVEFNKGLTLRHWFDRAVTRFANRHMDLYENRLATIVPLAQLTFRLRPVK
ncbi:MAG: class I SAM-dependent methyltransferase [Bacteroidetes bacterium]|nr:MAG: class I SAM-dependent methyltransferase [Bacteroidota bacterium]